MKDKHTKYPQLRFKGCTDPWEQRKLGEITISFDSQRVPLESSTRQSGSYPYYGATGVIDSVNDYIFDGEYVLLAEDGANIVTRTSPIAYLTHGKFWLNNHAHIMKVREGSDYFLLSLLEKIDYSKFNSGTAQPKLNSKTVSGLNVMIPTAQEQMHIAALLRSLDKAIALHQRKLAKLKELKQGYLQKMFPKNGSKFPQLRFAGFADAWEQRELGDITEYIKGYAFKSKDYQNDGYRIIRVSDLGKDNIRVLNDPIFVSEEVAKQQIRYSIKANEIIITTVGSKAEMKESAVGRPIIVKESLGYLLNQNLVKVYGKSKFNNYFIYSQLLQTRYTNYISMIERGNANQANIAINDLWSYQLLTPMYEEQKKIGLFFQQLDNLITLHQRKLEKLQELKKGYLQKMFC